MNWTDERKKAVWRGAIIVNGNHPDQRRKDCCGAWIEWDQYGNDQSEFGWEIDHVFPIAKMEDIGIPEEEWHDIDNLRPMHHSNNASKQDDYPNYTSSVTAEDENNIRKIQNITVNKTRQNKINNLYCEYFDDDFDWEM